jgi:hypothetical protein
MDCRRLAQLAAGSGSNRLSEIIQNLPRSRRRTSLGCIARTRTYKKSHTGLSDAGPITQIDLQANADLKEIVAAWAQLTDPLKAAVLAIVRTAGKGADGGDESKD